MLQRARHGRRCVRCERAVSVLLRQSGSSRLSAWIARLITLSGLRAPPFFILSKLLRMSSESLVPAVARNIKSQRPYRPLRLQIEDERPTSDRSGVVTVTDKRQPRRAALADGAGSGRVVGLLGYGPRPRVRQSQPYAENPTPVPSTRSWVIRPAHEPIGGTSHGLRSINLRSPAGQRQ